MNLKLNILASALSLAIAGAAFAADEPKKDAEPTPDWTWTGHVDLNSAYYLRGITNTYGPNKWESGATAAYGGKGDAGLANKWGDAPESRNPALQWGFDIAHSSGFYLGYWASTLTYSYKRVGESYDLYRQFGAAPSPTAAAAAPLPATYSFWDYGKSPSIENDFYGGYTGKIGEVGYDLGMTYYYYLDGKYSNAPETKVKLTYGEFAASAQTLLQDTIWGNEKDTYWTFTWTKPLPHDFTFTANAGYYTYGKEGKFLGSRDTARAGGVIGATAACAAATPFFFVNGCYSANNPQDNSINRDAKVLSGGFRHLILGISQPIGSTGLTWNAQAIFGGVNRFNIKQDNKVTAGIAYSF